MRYFKFCFLNVRSLIHNFADFNVFVTNENYDVIGISETWLSDNIPSNLVHIDGYNFIRKDRDSRGGGVGIYLRTSFRYEILNNNSHDALEQIWIKFKLCNRTYIIGTLYRPPKKNLLEFMNVFEDALSDFTPTCSDIICGGDINIDLLDSENSKSIIFNDCIESYNLKQIINTPTRITKSSCTLLDVILISNDKDDYTCGTKEVSSISDHSLTFCSFKIDAPKHKQQTIKIRNFKRIDLDLLQEFLYLAPFENIINIENVSEKIEYFNLLILNIFDTLAPVKKIIIKKQKPAWLTDNIKEMISLKEKAMKKFNRTKNQEHWNYYKSIRNQTNIAIAHEKKCYLEFCINNNGNNSKALWNKLKELNIYNRVTTNTLPEIFNKPDEINNHFMQFSNNLSPPDNELLHFYNNNLKTNFKDLFTFTLVSDVIIYKYLLEIKSKSSGSDGINIDMLLLCCPHILPFITNIINTCILEGVFPDTWKISRVVPLPKKNDISSFGDLRPISILPVLSKLLEKIMNCQIREHINMYNILPLYQSGFRAGHSCTTALLGVMDDIITDIDSGKTTALILLDYSKAFDTISHVVLFSILHYVGFSNSAIGFIKNYLYNRMQFVETNNGKSGYGNILCGVPQGSILGPLLFCIYTSNITNSLNNCKIHLYADDTQIYFSFFHNNLNLANDIINDDLQRLVTMSERHNLTINPMKSSVLIFGKSKREVEAGIKVAVGNNELACTRVAKNLGVEIDTDLRFKQHVSKCVQKAYANLKCLYPNRKLLSQSLKIKLTDTLVLSHFNYCDVLYGPCLDKMSINKIEKVQKACLRYIYGIRKYERVSHKLNDVKWLNMVTRRQYHSVTLFHNIILKQSPPYLSNKIKYRTDVHTLNLRFRGLISPPPHKTTLYRRCFSYNIFFLYNKLPIDYKNLGLARFKFIYKKYLLTLQ